MEEPSNADLHNTSLAPPPAAESSSPVYKRKRVNPYRMSSVIKLEYDLSNPVYTRVKNLVLLYILRWFLPNGSGKEQLVGMAAGGQDSSLSPPLLLSRESEDELSGGVDLMKRMWFTSRDNVNLLLEICRQGFTTLTDPVQKRLLVDLYRHWNQVRR